jgi:hypothetical protein
MIPQVAALINDQLETSPRFNDGSWAGRFEASRCYLSSGGG